MRLQDMLKQMRHSERETQVKVSEATDSPRSGIRQGSKLEDVKSEAVARGEQLGIISHEIARSPASGADGGADGHEKACSAI